MNNDEREQGNTEFSIIKPTEIKLTKDGSPVNGAVTPARSKRHRWLWPVFTGLMIMALAVVFLLPQWIKPPVLSESGADGVPTPSAGKASTPSAENASTTNGTSPWSEAQAARKREESQELLSQLLKTQQELEQKKVQSWGAEAYNATLQLANEGDVAYRERDFQKATSLYNEALVGMKELLAEMEVLFAEAIRKGNTALDNGDSARAAESFQLALLMKPEDERALAGLQRSATLDQVLDLITQGNNLEQNDNYEEARLKYQQALKLDSQAETATGHLKAVNEKIRDRDFNRLMSAGYAHLQADELEKARAGFEQASRLKPGSTEVQAAINQTSIRITNTQITASLARAAEFAQAERWNDALVEYDKALALDKNLVQAQEGRQYARSRAQLDAALEQTLAQPGRLSDKAVYEETRLLLQQASTIPDRGQRLAQQLATLKKVLDYAAVPVEVTFKSDNLTEVVVYKIGTLGKFGSRSLTLTPGNYTAVGSRSGYRDVRVEFTVEADKPEQTVIIQAEEKIAAK